MEKLILKLLITNEAYYKRIIGFLKYSYFKKNEYKKIFDIIKKYHDKYKKSITFDYLVMEVADLSISDNEKDSVVSIVEDIKLFVIEEQNLDYLLDKTEDYIKNVSIENAILESVDILKSEDKSNKRIAIPNMLREALSVSIKGIKAHNYTKDAEERYDAIHNPVDKIKTDIDVVNEMTDGGFERKTLNVYLAGTNVGKTAVLCHHAASFLMQGLNVVYLTLEVSDIKISTRIDQNLFNITNKEIKTITKDSFKNNINKIIEKTRGKLYVAEYPSASVTVDTIEALFDELEIKEDFHCDVLIVDYITLMRSNTVKSVDNLYSFGKLIVEEVRGFASKKNIVVLTAAQLTRSGYDKLDLSLKDVAESFAICMTADWSCGISQNEELDAQNKYLFKLLKTRYDVLKTFDNKYLVGIDKSKQKLYNLSNPKENIKGYFSGKEEDELPISDDDLAYTVKDKSRDFSNFKFS